MAALTAEEHLTEIKDLFVRGAISTEEARSLDTYWRLRMIEERRRAPTPLSVPGGPVDWRLKSWRTGCALRIAPWLGGHGVR